METNCPPSDWFGPDMPSARRFAIYLPTLRRDGHSIDHFLQIQKAVTGLLAKWFGGVTAFPAHGIFVKGTGEAEEEEIVIAESYCEQEAWERHSSEAKALVQFLVSALHQESIACLLDGNMILLGGPGDGAAERLLCEGFDEHDLERFLRSRHE